MQELINRINDVLEGMALTYDDTVTSRTNLRNLIKNYPDFTMLGCGNFCSAYLHVPTGKVVKFIPQCWCDIKNEPSHYDHLDTDTERMLEYLRDCMEQKREWMPEVNTTFSFSMVYEMTLPPHRWDMVNYRHRCEKPRRRGTKVLKPRDRDVKNMFRCTVVVMEKLQPIINSDGEFISDEIRKQYRSIERAMPARHDVVWPRLRQGTVAWREYLKKCNKRRTSDQFAREVRKYVFSLSKRTNTDRINIDISNENVMMRGNQIIINDPIY